MASKAFHSTGVAMTNPRQPMAFLIRIEDTDNLFLCVRPRDPTKDNKQGEDSGQNYGFENKEALEKI